MGNGKTTRPPRIRVPVEKPNEGLGKSKFVGDLHGVSPVSGNGLGDANIGVKFVVYGEPASKANSRRFIRPGLIIKSQKALSYAQAFKLQTPKLQHLMLPPLAVEMTIYYASMRPDLDESLILDCMQGVIYDNDRSIWKKVVTRGIDKDRPRSEIWVYPLGCE